MAEDMSCRNNGTIPIVDQSKCEAKGQCVAVCPYHVFELRPRTPEEISELTFMGKIKARAHIMVSVYYVNKHIWKLSAL